MYDILAFIAIVGFCVFLLILLGLIARVFDFFGKCYDGIINNKKYETKQVKFDDVIQLIDDFNTKYQNIFGNTYLSESLCKKIYDDFHKIHMEITYTKRADYKEEYKPILDKFEDIGDVLRNVENKLDRYNQYFVKKEIAYTHDMLSDVEGHSLDEAQRTAVVTDEDANLVVAGAGSGKTLTIVGKIKYLIERKHILPEEILILSFTGKVVDEMKARVKSISDKLVVQTFHKLGCDIISKNQQIDVFDGDDFSQFIKQYLNSDLIKDKNALNEFIQFFAYFLHIPPDKADFKTLGEVYEHSSNVDFETMQSKYFKSLTGKNTDKRTLHGETVKSIEELIIANFLFLHGIDYVYETKYPFQLSDMEYKVYRPDFYLIQQGIWLEHFGINELEKAPWLEENEQQYLDGIRWKREWHRLNGTKLVETYSWYVSRGILLDKLRFCHFFCGINCNKINKYLSLSGRNTRRLDSRILACAVFLSCC